MQINKKLLYLALFIITASKLWIATHTFGTNDVKYWHSFMEYLVAHDVVSIYPNIAYYNHPPFMSVFLLFLHTVTAHHPELFPFFMRIPAITADIGSSLLVYALASRFLSQPKAFFSSLIVALSPLLVEISGFHGNTDPVFIFLIVLATYLLSVKKNPAAAGLVFGMAFNIKIVPIICIPYFFFFNPTWRSKFIFFSTAAIPVTLGFGYNLIKQPMGIITNVFLYKSLVGNWGITKLFPSLWPEHIDSRLKLIIITLLVLSAFLLSMRANKSKESERIRLTTFGLGLIFLVFLTLTPGFGVQYLSWLVPTGIFLGLYGAILYNCIGGIFLFAVYTYWSQGFPWYNADSDIIGPWKGTSETLDVILWGYLSLWLLLSLWRLFKISLQSNSIQANT